MNHITSLLRGIIRTHIVLGLTFTAAILPLSAGNRPASETAAAPTVRNVVLVHGAFADGSSWAKVIPLLEAKGLHVTAVQNPLSSLADDVAATKRAIAMQEGPVILVGHSWAGMVISEAGNDPKVTGLVYVAAIVPDEGQSAGDVVKPYPPSPGLAEAKPDAAGFLSLSRKGIDEDFVPDLPPAERAIVYATQGPWNSACLADKVSVPAWTTKPSWYIAVNDRMLSSHPAGGYDKKTQAADIRSVLTQLGIDHAAIVGHDIGATVAYAYAARYPDKTDRLVVMDAPVPGIPPWDEIVRSPALWHFSFGGPDAERLVAGRERIYLDRFWNEFAGDPSKIDEATRVHYTAFYARPGAMHSAFAQFLSIPKDAEDNKVSMTTKLTMPVLAIGAAKAFGANVAIVMRNAADNVTEVLIANSGHWLMDEQPTATIAAVRNFLDRKTTTQSLKLGK